MANQLNVAQIARICHEANRLYSEDADLPPHMPWGHAPEWQRASAIKGVEAIMADPWMGPADSHASWYAEKVNTGWVYGPVKDDVAKTHPCMVPYAELPEAQRLKDTLFVNIVRALIPASVWDKQKREGFDPAASLAVGTGEAVSLQTVAANALAEQVQPQGESHGEIADVAEEQPAGEAAEADRDGGQPASEEGRGSTDTAEVIGEPQIGEITQSSQQQQIGEAVQADLGQATGVTNQQAYDKNQSQT